MTSRSSGANIEILLPQPPQVLGCRCAMPPYCFLNPLREPQRGLNPLQGAQRVALLSLQLVGVLVLAAHAHLHHLLSAAWALPPSTFARLDTRLLLPLGFPRRSQEDSVPALSTSHWPAVAWYLGALAIVMATLCLGTVGIDAWSWSQGWGSATCCPSRVKAPGKGLRPAGGVFLSPARQRPPGAASSRKPAWVLLCAEQ